MLKFRGSSNNREFLGLILEEGNLTRLREGHPIHILKEEMDLPFDILIMHTKDLAATVRDFQAKGLVDNNTVIHDERARKRQ